MSGNLLNPTQETVRYKNRKSADKEDQDAEILISSSFDENRDSEEEEKSFSQSKICFYSTSIFITLLILFVILGTLCYSTDILQSSLEGSCVPLQQVKKVIISSERTDLESCSDNKTCHTFLNVIEQKHDGLKYNFVIGQRGELYIGGGFKCLANSDENVLYVKLLRSEKLEPFEDYLKMCFRLSEIVNHGIWCEKISPDYAIQDEKEICSIIESGKNKSYHVHDPEHEMKLIHGDFGWTTCGTFSTTANMESDRVITLESLPKKSCSPLRLVDEITVDVVETSPFDCSDEASCMKSFEEHHDGLNYNFIIGHHHDVYVGLGFNCKLENISDNILKIKVLTPPEKNYYNFLAFEEQKQVIEIIYEGVACGKISEVYSVKANCNIAYHDQRSHCEYRYSLLIYRIASAYIKSKYYSKEYYNITSEHGRGIVPRNFNYQLCHRNHQPDTSTFEYEYEYD